MSKLLNLSTPSGIAFSDSDFNKYNESISMRNRRVIFLFSSLLFQVFLSIFSTYLYARISISFPTIFIK